MEIEINSCVYELYSSLDNPIQTLIFEVFHLPFKEIMKKL